MKKIFSLLVLCATVVFASCSKDKESGTIAFDSPAVFLNAGDAVTVGFSASNIESFSITGKPTGWSDPVIDAANRTITVVSPEKFDDDNDAVKSGSVTLTGKVHGGSTASATLFVGVVDTEDLSDKPANCYLINKKETNYLINAMYKGDVTEQVPSSVDVVWQSRSNLIQYLELKDGKASFYVAADSDDGDKIKEGNAVIGAYDAGGTLIWSWHVWAADYDPDAEGGAVDFNGYSMMTRNLGALAADNSSVENILASYGLYYQWGRKDPLRPSNGLANTNKTWYDKNGTSSQSNPATENFSAGVTCIMNYILKPDVMQNQVSGDNAYANLWSVDNTVYTANDNPVVKTVYDPSPVGFKLPPGNVFTGFTTTGGSISTSSEINGTWSSSSLKGWNFYTDSSKSKTIFFPASGYRYRSNGMVSNVSSYGFCWSAVPSSPTKGHYLYFSSLEVIPLSTSNYRAVGFGVRSSQE